MIIVVAEELQRERREVQKKSATDNEIRWKKGKHIEGKTTLWTTKELTVAAPHQRNEWARKKSQHAHLCKNMNKHCHRSGTYTGKNIIHDLFSDA